jgi:heme A synthase
MANLIVPIVALYVALWGVGFVSTQIFLHRLRHQFEGEWIRLGKPGMFFNNNIRSSISLMRYIWGRGYSRLDNPKFTKFGNFLRSVIAGFVLVFALTIAVLIFSTKENPKVSNHSTELTSPAVSPVAGHPPPQT